MSDAKRDTNSVTTLLAVSNADGITPVVLWADPVTHRLLTSGTAAVAVGTTLITGGSTTNILYDNAGVVGEYTITGTGTVVVMQTSPTLSNPTVGTQAATDNSTLAASTAYVTTAVANAIAGVNPAVAVQCATTVASDTSALTYVHVAGIGDTFTGAVNTAITIDGHTLVLNDRVLIKNDTQTSPGAVSAGTFNGVYLVTQVQTGVLAPILTRALDYDTPTDINNTGAIPVVFGTANANTSWLLTSNIAAVGTGSNTLTYAQFSVAPSTIVIGPASATDGVPALFNGTTGKLIKNSTPTGTGNPVMATSPTLITPMLGVATATSIDGLIITATAGTLTIANSASASLITSGNFALTLTSTATTNSTFPSGTHTLAGLDVVQNWTANQTFSSGNLISSAQVINGTVTGTGASATPTASILAMFDANKNLSANNFIDGFTTTATAAGTTTLTIGSTGIQVFTGSTTQTVTLPTTSVVAGGQYIIVNNSTGAVTVQSSGANTITILPANTSAIFTAVVATPTTAANWNSQYIGIVVTSGKKLSVSNTMTFAGTDATTMTFPGASDTVGGLGTAQTWTAQNKFNNIVDVNNAITASGNAATVPVTYRLSTVTNNSAATLTITMTTASAVDGQMTVVRILDFSAVAQTITWVNTENSTVTAPTTSNGSTTSFLTVGFMYNASTSKWRCIASA